MVYKLPIADACFFKLNSDNIIELKNSDNLEDEFYNYAIMYKKSARLLTNHLFEVIDISKLDTYFFPIAYLYRHSIELILKAIGFKYIVSLEDRKAFIKDTFHNLSKILIAITPYVQKFLDKDIDAYRWLLSYFEDINTIDRESDSFRYPFRISVEKRDSGFETVKEYSITPVFNAQTDINLIAFANKMEVTFELLNEIFQETFIKAIHYKDYKPVFLEYGGSYYGKSVVGYRFNSEKFYPYVKAYTTAPEYIYNMICKEEEFKDVLFIPMCYLYRNAVELSLKEILLEECSFGWQEALNHINNKKHKVLGMWNLIKEEIREHAHAPKDDPTIINAEKYITQLNNIDGSSDKFRYPTDKYLNLHFKRKNKFDIDNVNKFFVQLLSFLDGVILMMSSNNEWKSEMEAEYSAEMKYEYDIEGM